MARSDRSLSWIHLVFLFAVSITPFSTTLLASFIGYRIALLTYWVNIVLLGRRERRHAAADVDSHQAAHL